MRILFLSWLFLIPLFQILPGKDIVCVSGQCLNDQRSLLLQLKNSLEFSSSMSTKLVYWNQTTTDCCEWSGVICDQTGRVISLDLNSESISNGIENSSSLFSFQFLQRLNLAFNRFNSTEIPSGFFNLTSLTYLNLSNAGFSGQIPIEFSRMTRLVTLELSTLFPVLRPLKLENPNLLKLVQNLTDLIELHLDGVDISSMGSEWCRALSSSLPKLQVLSLSNCRLSGPIDSSLMRLQSLSIIRLAQNYLNTSVPKLFANFTNLTVLRLSSCNLQGEFPQEILQVPTLETLDLSNNGLLHGSLPEFPQNGSFQSLMLSYTRFSGSLPNSIGNLQNLSRMELSNCNFSGPIPSSIASLRQLVYLDFSFNNLTGSIPSFNLSKNLTQINLAHNKLTGEMSSSHWQGLQNLVNIDLQNNFLNGSIPISLFSLPSLEKILLSNNQFAGQLSDLSNVSSHLLDTLDLSSNNLKGPIPRFVFQFKGLNVLSLSSNRFNGSIRLGRIENLKNLTTLDLSYNKLSIDASSSNFNGSSFPRLSTLKLASCNLNVFPNLANQSKLTYLDLSINQIHGEIPQWVWSIGNLNLSYNRLVNFEGPLPPVVPNLGILDLHSNSLQGQIPILAPSASVLDYSYNNFSSIIPADIGNKMSFTIFFSLSNNRLTGNIPDSICNATYLQVLDLSNNELNGIIPKCLINMGEILGVLNLRGNNLIGTIPEQFPLNCALKTLDVRGNQLEGLIPESLANCKMLEVLNLGNNKINGSFPCFLKNSSNLRVLVLRSNRFHGNIRCPEAHKSWSNLQIIDIASNNFNGTLPPKCFSNWRAMANDVRSANHLRFAFLSLNRRYYRDTVTITNKGVEMELVNILELFISIDFSCNNFQGEIPDTVGDLGSLYGLNLSHNALTGPIPPSIRNLTQLESLDLSVNKIKGTIPTGLTNLTFLSFLNFSYNQLHGRIPTGSQFSTFEATSYLGNTGLCGSPLNASCGNTASPPSSPPPPPDNTGSTARKEFDWKFIITGLGFGVGAGVVVGPSMFWKRGRDWYDEHIVNFFLVILPTMGSMYISCDGGKVEVEETIEEPTDDSGDSEDEMEDEAFRGRYCVFCTKLDFSREKAMHNPKCKCHDSPSISSFSSSSSSFS